jgi:carboxypeptidase D
MRRAFFFTLATLAVVAAAADYPALVLIHATRPADVAALRAEGVDVDTCLAKRADGVVAYVRAEDFDALTALGFGYDVLYADARDAVRWTDEWAGPRYAGGRAIPYDHYLSYEEFTAAMQELANTYPDFTRLSSVGTTVNGRDIWGLKISDEPDAEAEEPEFRIVGAHHGNEKIGYMVALYATEQLCALYGSDPDVTALVDGAELWCIPMMNCDGVVNNTRYNVHGVDLNRNYSYAWEPGGGQGPAPFSEPETQAIRNVSLANTFVMSHSYHSGAFYVNYVWNYQEPMPVDLEMVQYLSDLYGNLASYPVTNGWAWYETHGDLNDWSYGERSDPDDTIEVWAPSYNPPTAQILAQCERNWPAILQTFRASQLSGVRGWVKDYDTNEPLAATVTALEVDWPVYTDTPVGDYYKLLRPGTFTMKASAPGYASATEANVVVAEGGPTVVNFYLHATGTGGGLAYFKAEGKAGGVALSWETVNGDAAAFNLYRVAGRGGSRERVNGEAVTGRSPYRWLDAGVGAGRWRYELTEVDAAGRETVLGSTVINYAGPTAVKAFTLAGPYPNPARDRTTVAFALPRAARARLAVYDLAGREVSCPLDAELAAGAHEVALDVSALAPGIYVYRLQAGTDAGAKRLAVIK